MDGIQFYEAYLLRRFILLRFATGNAVVGVFQQQDVIHFWFLMTEEKNCTLINCNRKL
jgi:hypothetical protein